MISNRVFSVTLTFSILLHCVFLCAIPGRLNAQRQKSKPIEVSYIQHKERTDFLKKSKPQADLRSKTTLAQFAQPVRPSQNTAAPRIEAINLAANEKVVKDKKGFLNYFQYLKEAIRHSANDQARLNDAVGQVYIMFTLNSKGLLQDLRVIDEYSSDDPMLRQAAANAIRDAGPFKKFPKSLDAGQISFNLIIAFEKDHAR